MNWTDVEELEQKQKKNASAIKSRVDREEAERRVREKLYDCIVKHEDVYNGYTGNEQDEFWNIMFKAVKEQDFDMLDMMYATQVHSALDVIEEAQDILNSSLDSTSGGSMAIHMFKDQLHDKLGWYN